MADDNDQAKNLLPILGAAAVGAAVGAALALMLAPKSGAELREDIKKHATEAKDKAEEFFRTTVAETAAGIKEKVQEHLSTAQEEDEESAPAEEA